MLSEGEAITVPDRDNPGNRVAATYLETAVGQPIGGRDSAWVQFEDGPRAGCTGRYRIDDIRPA